MAQALSGACLAFTFEKYSGMVLTIDRMPCKYHVYTLYGHYNYN